jgi:saccharopine dehydrogenase-like NADP-dependent oxidoreductase
VTKAFCLGGAGRIAREAALDLVKFSNFERITIGDFDETTGREVAAWLNDPRVDFRKVDVKNHAETVSALQGYDIVLDGTTISLNRLTTACMADAGVNAINLNGFGEESNFDGKFKAHEKICVPGFGMTPGTTNMLVCYATERLDSVETVRVSRGAFRPIAFSPSIIETTVYEYDPHLPDRVVFEDGEFIQVPPFARPLEVKLPNPYGTHVQYIIPHAETRTLAAFLADKGVRLIEVRGTWPPSNMELLRALYDWGFMRNDRVRLGEMEFGVMEVIGAYLQKAPEGQSTPLYGYALHVEVTGKTKGISIRHTLTHSHPSSDGSVKGWEGLRAYTRCVAIPFAIGAELIASGRSRGIGVVNPEVAFIPAEVLDELSKRNIYIHEEIHAL